MRQQSQSYSSVTANDTSRQINGGTYIPSSYSILTRRQTLTHRLHADVTHNGNINVFNISVLAPLHGNPQPPSRNLSQKLTDAELLRRRTHPLYNPGGHRTHLGDAPHSVPGVLGFGAISFRDIAQAGQVPDIITILLGTSRDQSRERAASHHQETPPDSSASPENPQPDETPPFTEILSFSAIPLSEAADQEPDLFALLYSAFRDSPDTEPDAAYPQQSPVREAPVNPENPEPDATPQFTEILSFSAIPFSEASDQEPDLYALLYSAFQDPSDTEPDASSVQQNPHRPELNVSHARILEERLLEVQRQQRETRVRLGRVRQLLRRARVSFFRLRLGSGECLVGAVMSGR
ncbi:hypothetical protein BJ508DRAFT_419049 [Ascobolus immersus RN42]|uniref:Uncharacterized protein n=1 Tax=Ascobolus immersus RN42 TaxID=1160509 RepID=A0A3N4HNM2_ASCIM|nr:hypothetical protein BJ508DRAFT_419049 [Ascobolus immersus RN42]